MSEENMEYIVPNRAVPLTVVESNPINENWETIEEALNKNFDLASRVESKIDISEKGVQGGVATLDINNKLNIEELPEQAKGHIYEVDSLIEQLSLQAFTGDICVRRDLGKSYALKAESAMEETNWVEIASINAGGEILGNASYSTNIQESTWEYDQVQNIYYINIDSKQHSQGANKNLLAIFKNDFGQNIFCDYVVDDLGLVTIYSDVPFEGRLTISNLSGNCNNLDILPYSIVSGYKLNDNPAFITYSYDKVSISTSVPLVIVDGFNIIHNITWVKDLEIDNNTIQDGNYIIFIDTDNIEENNLNQISYIEENKYLGLVDNLPEIADIGDRCYVIFDRSYQYTDQGWTSKAFLPIGEFLIKNGLVNSANSYNFMQNGVNVNYASHELDYLLGDLITGLNITFSDILKVEPGNCLVEDRIVKLKNTMIKNYDLNWEEGSGLGCLDPDNVQDKLVYHVVKEGQIYYTDRDGQINSYLEAGSNVYYDSNLNELYKESEDNEFLFNGDITSYTITTTGWGNIFLISSNKFNKSDIFLSYSNQPTLPSGYNICRRIGYFYRDENLKFMTEVQIKDKNYLYEPQVINTTISNEISQIPVNLPLDVEVVFGYKLEQPENIVFYYNGVEIYEECSKNNTLTLPCYDGNLEIKGEKDTNITIKVLGYLDRREL